MTSEVAGKPKRMIRGRQWKKTSHEESALLNLANKSNEMSRMKTELTIGFFGEKHQIQVFLLRGGLGNYRVLKSVASLK